MRSLLLVLAILPIWGCSEGARQADTGATLKVAVAPLSLSSIADADYTIAVHNGPDGTGDLVWQRTIKSSQYGDGAGSVTYVGPCDAATGINTVTLTLTALYDPGLVDSDSWQNPTPVSLEVLCRPNTDTLASFDLTVLRDARQGFFDVAVEFDDIFCSAKLDCIDGTPTQDLELLHNPSTNLRDLTAVLGFACAGSPSGATWLWMNDPVIQCAGFAPQRVTFGVSGVGNVDLEGPGHTNPGAYLFGAAVYRGTQVSSSIAYWNVAFGLNELAFASAGACTLTLSATATETSLTQVPAAFVLPEGEVYPVIEWDVPLSNTTGRVCTAHEVNADTRVRTRYVGFPNEAAFGFMHGFERASASLVSACSIDCPLSQCGTDGECAAPTCFDNRRNSDETDIDCGGSCGPCADGLLCDGNNDCASAVCDGTCLAPSCSDIVQNGGETGLDCGGPCDPCDDGMGCADALDCVSGVCEGNLCAVPTCSDLVRNGDETAPDCGGTCDPCADSLACVSGTDCMSGICESLACSAPTCSDLVENGAETATDCGGSCEPCGDGLTCTTGTDCVSGVCVDTCQSANCEDQVQNGDETAMDCGGGCLPCADGLGCSTSTDCQSGVCVGSLCAAPTCVDGVVNGDETDLDCGGNTCPDCEVGELCATGSDCESGVCNGTCSAPTCSDNIRNGDELGVDCGGSCGGCSLGIACGTGSDCASGFCGPGPDGTCHSSVCSSGAADGNGATRTCTRDSGTTYEVRLFRNTGNSTFVAPPSVTQVEALIVAGGGGAGGSAHALGGGGGGGAGGLIHRPTQTVTGGQSYSLSVGGGGGGGNAGPGGTGGHTSAFGFTALGGGGGGSGNTGGVASSGGSGGGAGYNGYLSLGGAAGTSGQGHAGGSNLCSNWAAGGGGAGGVGQNQGNYEACGVGYGRNVLGGLGGPGLTYALTGEARTYAKGGDGSISAPTDQAPGPANTGFGGNGTYAAGQGGVGGAGGSGVVIVRFVAPAP